MKKKKTILSTINENAQKQPRGGMSAFFFEELADEKNWDNRVEQLEQITGISPKHVDL